MFNVRCSCMIAGIKPCDISEACSNHGNCTSTPTGSYTCACLPGYTGFRCETDINECASSPCQNGGSCNDLVNGYNCSCPDKTNGTNCENVGCPMMYQCTSQGYCYDDQCSCLIDYTGLMCETKQEIGCKSSLCVCFQPVIGGDMDCICENVTNGCNGVLAPCKLISSYYQLSVSAPTISSLSHRARVLLHTGAWASAALLTYLLTYFPIIAHVHAGMAKYYDLALNQIMNNDSFIVPQGRLNINYPKNSKHANNLLFNSDNTVWCKQSLEIQCGQCVFLNNGTVNVFLK